MQIIPVGYSIYCDTGPHEGKHRVQATVYLSDEELSLLQQNYGAELIVTLEES